MFNYDDANYFTFDDDYFLISAEIGYLYRLISILSMNVKYKYSITYDSYGTTEITNWGDEDDEFGYWGFVEDNKHISYGQIQLGFSYYLPNPK